MSFVIGQSVYAMNKCQRLLEETPVSRLIQNYGLRFQVVSQNDRALSHSGKACGLVCAANLMQGLRVALGNKATVDPVNVLNIVVQIPDFQNGVSPRTFEKLVSELKQHFLPETTISVETNWLAIGDGEMAESQFAQMSIGLENIKGGARKAQALLLLPYNSNRRTISSGHWVLLRSKESNSVIKISDPNIPRAELEMTVERETLIFLNGKKLPTLKLVPLRPQVLEYYNGQYGQNTVFMVMSVITVTAE